ncbi:hypothetical protein C8R47DRAFT_595121 [Mycena vitilis]|nr:hypothetical protein C8R47DRAFT_595121 [Mycena vitilis]
MDADFINMLSGLLLPPDPSLSSSQGSHAVTQLEDSWQAHSFEDGAGFDVEQTMFHHTEEGARTAASPAGSSSSSSTSSAMSAAPSSTSSQSPANTSSAGFAADRKAKPRVPCLRADCDRHFKNDYTRSLHMKSHNVKHPRLFPCRWCSLVLSRDHDRMRHEVAKHNIKPQYRCTLCRKSFSREKNLAKHRCSVAR